VVTVVRKALPTLSDCVFQGLFVCLSPTIRRLREPDRGTSPKGVHPFIFQEVACLWTFISEFTIYPHLKLYILHVSRTIPFFLFPLRLLSFYEQYRKDAQVAHKSNKVSVVYPLY